MHFATVVVKLLVVYLYKIIYYTLCAASILFVYMYKCFLGCDFGSYPRKQMSSGRIWPVHGPTVAVVGPKTFCYWGMAQNLKVQNHLHTNLQLLGFVLVFMYMRNILLLCSTNNTSSVPFYCVQIGSVSVICLFHFT